MQLLGAPCPAPPPLCRTWVGGIFGLKEYLIYVSFIYFYSPVLDLFLPTSLRIEPQVVGALSPHYRHAAPLQSNGGHLSPRNTRVHRTSLEYVPCNEKGTALAVRPAELPRNQTGIWPPHSRVTRRVCPFVTHGSGSTPGRGEEGVDPTRAWRERSPAAGEGPRREGRFRLCPHRPRDLG